MNTNFKVTDENIVYKQSVITQIKVSPFNVNII